MKNKLKELFRATPIHSALRENRRRRLIRDLEKKGRPAPPPHIVKQRAILEFAEKYDPDVFVETGTFRGDMVEAMAPHFQKLYSIELSVELFEKAKDRFAGEKRVEIRHGDSGIVLGEVVADLEQSALFWLDGHYSGGETAKGDKETPIFEELAHVFGSRIKEHVILIDDARCFGKDPAYPDVEELREFVEANSPGAQFEIKDDSIRIVPSCLIR